MNRRDAGGASRLKLDLRAGAEAQGVVESFLHACGLEGDPLRQVVQALADLRGYVGAEGENRFKLELKATDESLEGWLADTRELPETGGNGDPHRFLGDDGGWDSPLRATFDETHYLEHDGVWGWVLLRGGKKTRAAGGLEPLPLKEHKVFAGSAMAG